jgi:hypothetical protein
MNFGIQMHSAAWPAWLVSNIKAAHDRLESLSFKDFNPNWPVLCKNVIAYDYF